MKTAEQIAEYLREQDWFSAYIDNLKRKDLKPLAGGTYEDHISGRKGLCTISNAFYWTKTEQGNEFWSDIDDEFVKWWDNDQEDIQ